MPAGRPQRALAQHLPLLLRCRCRTQRPPPEGVAGMTPGRRRKRTGAGWGLLKLLRAAMAVAAGGWALGIEEGAQ